MKSDLKNKKILVTGGGGFLGKHVVKNLLEKRGVPKENIFTPSYSECDLTKQDNAARAVAGKDFVIHLAAYSVGIGSHVGPATVFYGTTTMGLNVLEAARQAGVEKFVSIGSANEYPQNVPMPLQEKDLWNGLPGPELLPYSMAKKAMALAVKLYRYEYGLNAVHLIMASMYGPGFDPDNTLLVPTLIRQIKKAKENDQPHIIGWGSGNATRDFLYVEDAAEAIIRATERYDADEPLNIATGIETPMKILLETLCRLLNFNSGIVWDPTKPEGQLRYVLDVSRMQKELDFTPATSVEEGLRKTLS